MATVVRFGKFHGAGNDFIVIDGRGQTCDWALLARSMSDRHRGVGADGLLVATHSNSATIMMREFNPDGSEAEMSGNGIRCFAKYVVEQGISACTEEPLVVETIAGTRQVELTWENGRVSRARVAMGRPRLRSEEIPVILPGKRKKSEEAEVILDHRVQIEDRSLQLSFVSMGNPHAIAFLSDPIDQFPLLSIGPLIENHPMFPERINFSVVNMLSGNELLMRVWERGVGETLACGTGACAVAVAGWFRGLTTEITQVQTIGGTLEIRWDGQNEVYLEGPVVEVFQGEWSR